MYTVLLVDDDKLVRKGLTLTMPWEKYQLKIVGEASNGKKAIEIIEKKKVDIVFVDLIMPVMSGMDLLKYISKYKPTIHVVVLTCHQDFLLIQEAMRYGAIDYIVKTQLEVDSMDETLARIINRVRKNSRRVEDRSENPHGMVLIVPNNAHARGENISEINNIADKIRVMYNRVWYLPKNTETDQVVWRIQAAMPDTVIIEVDGTQGLDCEVISRCILDFINNTFFYSEISGLDYPRFTLGRDSHKRGNANNGNLEKIKSGISLLEWISNAALRSWVFEYIKKYQPDRETLIRIFKTAFLEWEIKLGIDHEEFYSSEEIGGIFFFSDFMVRINEIVNLVNDYLRKGGLSATIIEKILKALDILHQNKNLNLNQDYVSNLVGLSRSYFSECFKKITGKTYVKYLRNIKIIKAQTYLRKTDWSITLVAEKSGFCDEKYFSKIFKAHTGLQPTAYRSERTNDMDFTTTKSHEVIGRNSSLS